MMNFNLNSFLQFNKAELSEARTEQEGDYTFTITKQTMASKDTEHKEAVSSALKFLNDNADEVGALIFS